LLLVASALPAAVAVAGGHGEPGEVIVARVELDDPQAELRLLGEMKIDVDAVFPGWARVYVLQEELDKLRHLGFRVTLVPIEDLRPPEAPPTQPPAWTGTPTIPAEYHTYATLTSELQAIASANPGIVRLYSIGQSVQGRELWMVKITDNPDVDEDEPEVAYISSMHGDEVIGKELCVGLINYLVDNYGTLSRVTDLVDDTEIWIMPSMNPDGTELGQRYNANNVDLNRDFPDWYSDPVNTPSGRELETRAVMLWTEDRALTIAANFHGGSTVVNYPFDNNPTGTSGVESPTPDPDDPSFISISQTYADNNPSLFASNTPPFVNGITNGTMWYAIDGGMQDWAYCWYGIFETTIELDDVKWPAASTLPSHWDNNLESMLLYFERAHDGVRGIVTDASTGAPVAAEIRLDADPFPTYTDPDIGDYHRIVVPGTYTMDVSAIGFESTTVPIDVLAGPALRADVALAPLPADLQPIASRVEDGVGGNGYLDPAETASLAVTLENLGFQATDVSARLVPTGWYAEVTRADAAYPDLPPGQSGESLAPYHEVVIDPVVPDGYKAGFALEWSSAQASGTSEPFFLDVGGPSYESLPAPDVPQPIPDYQTITSQVISSSGLTVADVLVTVDISHSFIGDLVVTLTSPSGTSVVLHDRTGSGANDIVGTYGDDLVPAEPLSTLNGEPADGTWELTISDNAGGDTGNLNSWTLQIGGQPVPTAPPEMRFRDFSVDASTVTMRWWPYPDLTSYRIYRATDPSSAGSFVEVTAEDADPTDTAFADAGTEPVAYYLVTGVGSTGEGPKGHFGE
jgi:carboxypeptidase D